MAYVYQHIRLDTNEVFYIGIGSDTNGKYKRANKVTRRSEYWNNIVNKAGYKVEILTDGISWEEACEEERRLITHYGRKDINTGILTNLTDGGDGTIGRIYGDAWNKGKTNIYSEEVKRKISQGNVDRIYTEDFRRKQSENHTGKIVSNETKEKIRNSLVGKKASEETKQKMRDAWIKRKPNP